MKRESKCKELMTKDPVCCSSTDTVEHAAQLMKREDVGSVPVLANGKDSRLVGILTDRDITLNVVAEGRNPSTTPVADVMTKRLVTCGPEDDIASLLMAMADNQLRRIPVVDDAGVILGIIAQADVATRVKSPALTGKMVEEISA